MVDSRDMDDKLILKVLTSIPDDQWIEEKDMNVDMPKGTFSYLAEMGLLSYNGNVTGTARYRRNRVGNDWIRNYRSHHYFFWTMVMTGVILLLTLVLVVKAFCP